LKILHVYKDYFPVVGGIENHIRKVAERQAAAGHHVTVLATNPGREQRSCRLNGVHVIRAHRLATVASTPISADLYFALAREKPDVTHLHFPYPVGEISQWLAGDGRPYVITYHSDVIRQRRLLRLYRPLMRRVLRAAKFILVTSAKYLASSPHLAPFATRCLVVPLGIEPEPFLKAVPLPEFDDRPVLLFVGRHRYYKGVDDLIRAMPEISAHLVVAGDGPMRPRWEKLARKINVADQVSFPGQVEEQDLPRLYACADLFVLPANSRAEAFGTVLLEAMAAGLPCVTTEVGTGVSFVVQDGVTGLVVNPKSPEALAAAVNRLLADPVRSRQMGAAGRERVLREFTLSKLVDRLDEIYRQAIAR
jgi:glycosyltransferase involved in cell wall biosynthesis